MKPEDRFMADFIDADWLAEREDKENLHVDYLISKYKDRAPNPLVRWAREYSLIDTSSYLLIARDSRYGPIVRSGEHWLWTDKGPKFYLDIYSDGNIRQVLTSKRHFGKLWIALNCI